MVLIAKNNKLSVSPKKALFPNSMLLKHQHVYDYQEIVLTTFSDSVGLVGEHNNPEA